MKKQIKQVGYWAEDAKSWDQKKGDKLPMPIARASPWRGQRKFLVALGALESKLFCRHAKGTSKCRICGARNGSGTYTWNGFEWPDGFRHYVEIHNVKPPLEFRDAVINYKIVLDSHMAAIKNERPAREGDRAQVLDKAQLLQALKDNLTISFLHGTIYLRFNGELITETDVFR